LNKNSIKRFQKLRLNSAKVNI